MHAPVRFLVAGALLAFATSPHSAALEPPKLTLQAEEVLLSWSADPQAFLQSSPSASPVDWTDLLATLGQGSFREPRSPQARFYRLARRAGPPPLSGPLQKLKTLVHELAVNQTMIKRIATDGRADEK